MQIVGILWVGGFGKTDGNISVSTSLLTRDFLTLTILFCLPADFLRMIYSTDLLRYSYGLCVALQRKDVKLIAPVRLVGSCIL